MTIRNLNIKLVLLINRMCYFPNECLSILFICTETNHAGLTCTCIIYIADPDPAQTAQTYRSFHIRLSKLFGDNFLITCFYELILTWYASSGFLCSQKQNFIWIRQKTKASQNTPIVKIVHFGYVMSIVQSERFLQCGSMRKIINFCRILLKFRFWLYN